MLLQVMSNMRFWHELSKQPLFSSLISFSLSSSFLLFYQNRRCQGFDLNFDLDLDLNFILISFLMLILISKTASNCPQKHKHYIHLLLSKPHNTTAKQLNTIQLPCNILGYNKVCQAQHQLSWKAIKLALIQLIHPPTPTRLEKYNWKQIGKQICCSLSPSLTQLSRKAKLSLAQVSPRLFVIFH